ncbi:urea ABC transporter permease subunit UrtB [Limimaricola sp.]|uniref:urea ABC transporter permease subunit UrtB n=1 Tax=Limimaricola sp. TaxID=2211665 RepID=UPI00405958A0
MRRTLKTALAAAWLAIGAPMAQAGPVQDLLQEQGALIEESSRRSIGPAIDAIVESGLPRVQPVLQAWQDKALWIDAGGRFWRVIEKDGAEILVDVDTGAEAGPADTDAMEQIKPNSGIRALIGTALVRFQLSDPDPRRRQAALTSITRDPEPELLAPLRASIETETEADLRARKIRLERLLTMRFGTDEAERIAAIEALSTDTAVEVRAALNPLLATRIVVGPAGETPEGNVARELKPGGEALSISAAYARLVDDGLAPPRPTDAEIRAALEANLVDGRAGGVPLGALGDPAARARAYDALAAQGVVPPRVEERDVETALEAHAFHEVYAEPSEAVTDAARAAITSIGIRVGAMKGLDTGLDALSLASIYFLAAIGLAVTFGVMGVINMAHGEFIMIGAYTAYLVQQVVPDRTLSLIAALPAAFVVTFAAGVAMERLVIRHLYHRPLETLLATFGISIALQQLAKIVFGTQARPLTAPDWLGGAWIVNDVVGISHIRIAIFVLALVFLGFFLFLMKRTRLGLETRCVTQNPGMAASVGIDPGRVNMLTFGLGSGIAGIAGVAIGLYAKVTSEMGADYIVQSFMTVVVGGVGNIWGTLAGAAMIGGLQKGIEVLNPSNTLAAQTWMIVAVIIFIQFRPRGIIALRGRAAGD